MSVRSTVVMFGFTVATAAMGVVACEEDAPGSASSSGAAGSLGATSTPPPGAAADFCQKTLGVVVGALERCCTAADKETADYKVTGGIAAKLLPVCSSTLDASIAKGRVLYRAGEAEKCYAAYRTTYAADRCETVTQTYADPAGESCRRSFVGSGAASDACMGDHECGDGLTCVGYMKDVDGTCKAPPMLGEACGPWRSEGGLGGAAALEFGVHPSCAAGARCDLATSQCVKAATEGEACSDAEDCAPPNHCVRGTCSAGGPGGEGTACRSDDDCTPDAYCTGADGAPGTCAKKKAAGGSCTGGMFVTECIGRCDAEPGAPGTCVSFCGSP